MPDVSLPVYWGAEAAANAPGIMISFFPETESDSGLDSSTKNIIVEGKANSWADLDDFNVPSVPNAAENPAGNALILG
jgi:hypothetical protein